LPTDAELPELDDNGVASSPAIVRWTTPTPPRGTPATLQARRPDRRPRRASALDRPLEYVETTPRRKIYLSAPSRMVRGSANATIVGDSGHNTHLRATLVRRYAFSRRPRARRCTRLARDRPQAAARTGSASGSTRSTRRRCPSSSERCPTPTSATRRLAQLAAGPRSLVLIDPPSRRSRSGPTPRAPPPAPGVPLMLWYPIKALTRRAR